MRSRNIRRCRKLLAAGAIALISCGACNDLGPALASVGIAPVLTPAARLAYQALVTDGVTLTALRLQLVRANGERVVDRTAAISVGQDEIVLQFVVPLVADRETVRASLDLLAGSLVLFSGEQDLPLVAGSPSTAQIPLEFVGPVAPPPIPLPPVPLPPVPLPPDSTVPLPPLPPPPVPPPDTTVPLPPLPPVPLPPVPPPDSGVPLPPLPPVPLPPVPPPPDTTTPPPPTVPPPPPPVPLPPLPPVPPPPPIPPIPTLPIRSAVSVWNYFMA